jgi:hypothetical protein
MAAVTVEQIVDDLRELPPEKLAVVHDFVGYLRQRPTAMDEIELAEAGMDDYLSNLEDYEDRLVRGEIRWE